MFVVVCTRDRDNLQQPQNTRRDMRDENDAMQDRTRLRVRELHNYELNFVIPSDMYKSKYSIL